MLKNQGGGVHCHARSMSTSYHALKSTSTISTSLAGSTRGDAPGLKRVGVYAVMGFIMFISPTLFGKCAPDFAVLRLCPRSSCARPPVGPANGKSQGENPQTHAATNLKLGTKKTSRREGEQRGVTSLKGTGGY